MISQINVLAEGAVSNSNIFNGLQNMVGGFGFESWLAGEAPALDLLV